MIRTIGISAQTVVNRGVRRPAFIDHGLVAGATLP